MLQKFQLSREEEYDLVIKVRRILNVNMLVVHTVISIWASTLLYASISFTFGLLLNC